MWYEYVGYSDYETLEVFGEAYVDGLEWFAETNSGSKKYAKPFTKRKGDVHTHFNHKTFVKAKKIADDNMIKYSEYFQYVFEFYHHNSNWATFRGITSCNLEKCIEYVIESEKAKYENTIKLATSGKFNASMFDRSFSKNQNHINYQRFILSQIISKSGDNYLSMMRDFIKSDKLSLTFIKNYYISLYNEYLSRFGKRDKLI